MKISRKDLDGQLDLFCKAFGLRVAKAYNDVGAVAISGANGYVKLELIVSASGAVRSLGPDEGFSNSELYNHLRFSRYVMEQMEWEHLGKIADIH